MLAPFFDALVSLSPFILIIPATRVAARLLLLAWLFLWRNYRYLVGSSLLSQFVNGRFKTCLGRVMPFVRCDANSGIDFVLVWAGEIDGARDGGRDGSLW